MNNEEKDISGILLVFKEYGITSFEVIRIIRNITNIKKIGHAGTLDPLAEGLLIVMIGKDFTKKSAEISSNTNKQYTTTIKLGEATTTFDSEGSVTKTSLLIPSIEEIENIINIHFNGKIKQTPPIYSAKKVNGQKLCDLVRRKNCIIPDLKPVDLYVKVKIIDYTYPILKLDITCSPGTYIRSIANDLGELLGCFGYCTSILRTNIGKYSIEDKNVIHSKDLNKEYIMKNLIKEIDL